jgi:pyroglutamyl-peptidase
MRKLLLTGFEPFGGEKVNPSWEIARSLDGVVVDDAKIVAARLPVVWGRAVDVLVELINQERPDIIVSLGQSGREDLCVERVGINVSDASAGDNAGEQLTDAPIDAGGPVAYWSTLPIKAMVAAIRAAGVPARVSNSAGTYLCNHVMYGALHHLANAGVNMPCGFIHVPALPEQVALRTSPAASMGLETQIRGIRAALEVCIRGR